MQPVYEIGEIVEIIDNVTGHEFAEGQHVRIVDVDSKGEVQSAESLDGEDYWYIANEDIKKIEDQ